MSLSSLDVEPSLSQSSVLFLKGVVFRAMPEKTAPSILPNTLADQDRKTDLWLLSKLLPPSLRQEYFPKHFASIDVCFTAGPTPFPFSV